MTLFEVSQASRTHSVEFSQLYPHVPTFPARCCAQSLSRAHLCVPMGGSPPGSSVHGDSPGKNTGAGCHALLQRIFPTLGSNPGLLHCRWILYHLSHQGRPRILVEWVDCPFSRGNSPPRNLTEISCIAGVFFTS